MRYGCLASNITRNISYVTCINKLLKQIATLLVQPLYPTHRLAVPQKEVYKCVQRGLPRHPLFFFLYFPLAAHEFRIRGPRLPPYTSNTGTTITCTSRTGVIPGDGVNSTFFFVFKQFIRCIIYIYKVRAIMPE